MILSLFLAAGGCGGDSVTTVDTGDDGGEGGGGGGGGGGGVGTSPVQTTEVEVGNDSFDPRDIHVFTSGDGPNPRRPIVTWTWAGGSPTGHNVRFDEEGVSAPSPTQVDGTFRVTMPAQEGEYNYQCTIHPGMEGMVQVTHSSAGDTCQSSRC